MRCFFILLLSLILFSCSNSDSSKLVQLPENKVHFSIDLIGIDTYIVEITNPFVGTNRTEKYCLYPRTKEQPKIDGITHFIPTPISRAVITSTTHLGFLEPLGQSESIVGATNLSLFYSSSFQARVAENKIRTTGQSSVNEELLIQLNADVVFSYAIDVTELKKVEQLRKLGQKVILVSEFMEQDPLSKASWIKFMACFYDNHTIQKADSIFHSVEEKYNSVKKIASSAKSSPKVMIGYPWKGSWYVSGGNSFQASYLKASNSQYIWNRFNQEGSVPLATETVINDAIDADVWINCGIKQNLKELVEEDERMKLFKPYKLKKVYNNYKRSNLLGANDYWESGVIRPDLVLADLIKIMHPELMVEYEFNYYSQLN